MTKNQSFTPIIYSLLIITGIIIGSILKKPDEQNELNDKIQLILNLVKTHHVDSLAKNFNQTAINSILSKLDPHSSYIPAKKLKTIEEDMKGSFSGIGIQFNIINDSIVVIAAISGGPSKKLGILSGDRIVNVDNENVTNIKIQNEDVIKRLRGEKGSEVKIKIYRRSNNKLMDFTIIRDDIPLHSLDISMMLNNNIGYIKINRFSATTYNEFNSSTLNLLDQGMSKLILDLRGNPGGFLGMAIGICDELLKKENLIVYTEGRNRKRENIYATNNGHLQNVEVIILIDEGSASASEIIAGAIQDNDRGIVIGRRSFGKGLVQEQIRLNDGSAVRLTTQRYYTPAGRCIQKPYSDNNTFNLLNSLKIKPNISNIDSTQYRTKNGRIMYAGGGIKPDIEIKRPENRDYSSINIMLSKGWINEFCLDYALLIKKSAPLLKISDISLDEDNIYNAFLIFLSNKKKENFEIGKEEMKYLKNLLKATIARNIFDDKIYYKILSEEDEYIKEAILTFKNTNLKL